MSYTVTVDNFPEFIAKFATQVATQKSVSIDVYDDVQLLSMQQVMKNYYTNTDIVTMPDTITSGQDFSNFVNQYA
jgi:hypothetical protein